MNQYFDNNINLDSKKRVIKFNYGSYCYLFNSDNGVFSKNKIDYGSITLINTFLKQPKKINNFLDVGCGYGFISIVIAKELNIKGWGIDVNERALALAKENGKLNKVDVTFYKSNVYENVADKFDLIITNPPIRAGKKVVLEILLKAQNYLNSNGELWAVIRKDQGAKSIMEILKESYKVEIKAKNKGFYVFLAKKN